MNTKYIFFIVCACLSLMFLQTRQSLAGRQPEHSNLPETSRESLMQRFDFNGDGVITPDEYTGSQERFTQLDSDGNGSLSVDELPLPKAPNMAQENNKPKKQRQGTRQGRPSHNGGGFDKDDANNDGKVSQSEFSGPKDMFQQLDENGDGYITRDELQKNMGNGGPGAPPMSR